MIRPDYLRALGRYFGGQIGRSNRPRPPEAGMPEPAVPPRGPVPLEGGAEAPLE